MTGSILIFILSTIILFYLAECIGLYMQCEHFSDLKYAKKYIWIVPFIQIALFTKAISKAHHDNDYGFIWFILSFGQSSAFILSTLSNLSKEEISKNHSHCNHSYSRLYKSVIAAVLSAAFIHGF